MDIGLKLENHWLVECFSKDGILKWKEEFDNLVVTEGLTDILDKYFKGSTYTAAFYVGLVSATPTIVAGNTMASHAGWTEPQGYDEATRPALTLGSVAAGSVDNTASKAVFTMDGTSASVGGCFVTTDNTKGGTTGTLYGAGAFTEGDRAGIVDGDTLNISVSLSAAAA